MLNLDEINIIGLRKNLHIKPVAYSPYEVFAAVMGKLFEPAKKPVKVKNKTVYRPNIARVELDGDLIKANSQRYQLFFTKGLTCVSCGTVGKFFIKCKAPREKHYHLELVGQTPDGRYVLMTKDHIQPKSLGGLNILDNYQTMCTLCNLEKGNTVPV